MFFLAILNFILITYNFLIEGNEILNGLISDMWIFGIIFVTFYFPISTLIGRWHTNTQLNVDLTVKFYQDPILAKMIRTLLDVKTGKATDEEIEEFRKITKEIEKQDIGEF